MPEWNEITEDYQAESQLVPGDPIAMTTGTEEGTDTFLASHRADGSHGIDLLNADCAILLTAAGAVVANKGFAAAARLGAGVYSFQLTTQRTSERYIVWPWCRGSASGIVGRFPFDSERPGAKTDQVFYVEVVDGGGLNVDADLAVYVIGPRLGELPTE
jgi:hypothetical protein